MLELPPPFTAIINVTPTPTTTYITTMVIAKAATHNHT